MVRLLFATILLTLLYLPSNAQKETCVNQNDFYQTLIQSLDKSNILRDALEQGQRGNGIHYFWMSEMKKFGVKQVSYSFNFEMNENVVTITTVNDIAYHPVYYQYDIFITDEAKLKEISRSGLDEILKAEAVKRARNFLEDVINKKNSSAKGIVYINLLDDERLPILVDLPEIIYSQ